MKFRNQCQWWNKNMSWHYVLMVFSSWAPMNLWSERHLLNNEGLQASPSYKVTFIALFYILRAKNMFHWMLRRQKMSAQCRENPDSLWIFLRKFTCNCGIHESKQIFYPHYWNNFEMKYFGIVCFLLRTALNNLVRGCDKRK